MRITNLPPLHSSNNLPPRRKLPNQRLKAKDPHIRRLKRRKHRCRRSNQRPRQIILHAKSLPIRPAILQCRRQRSRHFPRPARQKSNNMLARQHGETCLDGVPRPVHQFRIHLIQNDRRHSPTILFGLFISVDPAVSTVSNRRSCNALHAAASRSTTNDGTCPPPDVTFANPVELNRVKNPHIFPRKR